jgi:hypothetical protein
VYRSRSWINRKRTQNDRLFHNNWNLHVGLGLLHGLLLRVLPRMHNKRHMLAIL